ncbi:MAG: 50S ribosome-binding GTPase [Acidobacteriota bacterium]|nr:MAG: 50S ribosome-binding GTPase [Acidobacteriota bacterium]
MPTNLTPEFRHAEQEYKRASTPEEKTAALKQMLSTIPKHKGTEKMQADIKRRLAKLKDEIRQQTKKRGFSIHVDREGAGQVTIVGPPNSGKSSLIASLSGVELEIAAYPFTTQCPHPAMMAFEDVQIQLVDLPPVSRLHTESWVAGIVRISDLVVIVVDLGADDALEQVEETLEVLEASKVRLVGGEPNSEPWASIVEKPALMIGTKCDLSGGPDNAAALSELYGDRFELLTVSAETGEGLDEARRHVFQRLKLIRVYSKPPHHEAELDRPYVLAEGSSLQDFASLVHKDFAEKLKFARVWGEGKYDGQRINRDFVLSDRDVVELHI